MNCFRNWQHRNHCGSNLFCSTVRSASASFTGLFATTMVSPATWGMTCPGCLEQQTRNYWRRSQWEHESPVIHWFTQCKVCDGEMPPRPAWHYSSSSSSSSSTTSSRTSQPTAAPPQPGGGISATAYVLRPTPEAADHVPVEALELIELMTGFDTDRASKFVEA